MCDSCGCGDPKVVPFDVHERILAGNDRVARHNREHFRDHSVVAVNLMGSPGAGKTAILEATARALGGTARLGVLAGDLATDNDATRVRAAGILAESITTGSACHLDAEMVHQGLHRLPWRALDYLFIENVGNLVCPAIYDLGQDVNVVALSVTEGEDKPLKYPTMFHKADLVLVTKADLLPHLPAVSIDAIERNLALVMPRPALLVVSAVTGSGIDRWINWLEGIGRPRPALGTAAAGAGRL
ncbi:MAG TPA: hydrogenase nickel incorporation protein HypB [Vicinamibacterales bacterium]|nr:hydrogenase nickel incorporation protein HypB [Vicinamibacterales bacterium]